MGVETWAHWRCVGMINQFHWRTRGRKRSLSVNQVPWEVNCRSLMYLRQDADEDREVERLAFANLSVPQHSLEAMPQFRLNWKVFPKCIGKFRTLCPFFVLICSLKHFLCFSIFSANDGFCFKLNLQIHRLCRYFFKHLFPALHPRDLVFKGVVPFYFTHFVNETWSLPSLYFLICLPPCLPHRPVTVICKSELNHGL